MSEASVSEIAKASPAANRAGEWFAAAAPPAVGGREDFSSAFVRNHLISLESRKEIETFRNKLKFSEVCWERK